MYRTYSVLNSPREIYAAYIRKLKLLNRLKVQTELKRNYSGFHKDFINGCSSDYIEGMYHDWIENPASVHSSWDNYFRNLVCNGASNVQKPNVVTYSADAGGSASVNEKVIQDHLAVQAVIRSYQVRGHLVALLDPLGIMYNDRTSTITEHRGSPPDEITRQHKLNPADMDRVFNLPSTTFIGGKEKALPLKEIIKRLELTYCRHIGVEYMHIPNVEECNFIRQKLEPPGASELSKEQKRLILERLIRSHGFEIFLGKKWSSEKRFGLEGCDIAVPALKQIIDVSSAHGIEMFGISMPHRGRLNVVCNVLRQPPEKVFCQFIGLEPSDDGSGDIKYHLGLTVERTNRVTNKKITMFIVANPSHLETVAPIAQGKIRAEQFYKGDKTGSKSVTLIMHGDAALAGQGICYETFHLSYLPCYTTHGSIHFVINNQVGFTTDPRFARSSPYCTDVGKVVNAPIFHVNADDPESVIHVCNVATEYRTKFKKDVVIDIVGYRRYGHQETDDPTFTQPLMYKKIRSLKPLVERYSEQAIKDGIATAEEIKKVSDEYNKILETAFSSAQKEKHLQWGDWIDSPWHGFFKNKDPLKCGPTGVAEDVLKHIGVKFSSPPPPELNFVIHKGLERIFKGRKTLIDNRECDLTIAEAFAFGSLLKEGIHVRVSGEDVERGTFANRHHILHHNTQDKVTYNMLSNLFPNQAPYLICNSSLCEYAIMGFDVGFALHNPNSLVIWEAQFGDFNNCAQPTIDQILAAGQAKWTRQCGIVLNLPHGLEGQGPEHSSARLERYLLLVNDDPDIIPTIDPTFAMRQLRDSNIIVTNVTTPANLFHLLRRQIALPFRKPLIQMSPKSLLRHPKARSKFDEMLPGTEFRRAIPEEGPASKNPSGVKKLVFCAGKVYYNFAAHRAEAKLDEQIAICRIEQISPFPYDIVMAECAKYPSAKLCWGQEEHKNSGAYFYCLLRIRSAVAGKREILYIGRPAADAPATGNKYIFENQEKQLKEAFLSL